MRFQIASISKTFTAAIIFQLEEEGKLSLDDSISRWIPSHPNIDSTTTIRQLLGHTSGIYDYMNDDTNGAVIFYTYLVDPEKTWTPEEVLASYVGTPNFKPGKGVRYSNTNYLLLGLIIEKITGNSVADEIHTRLLSKLDLQNTYVGWSDTVKGEMMHGWSIGFDSQDPTNQADISSIPSTAILSAAWTAGGLVSTAGDLAQWANALYSGQVINRTSLDKMLTFRTGSDGLAYGLGAFRFPYYSQPLYGHTGGLLGYSSWIFSAPDDSLSVSILVNSYTVADNGMNNIGIAVLNELYRTSGTNSVPLESGALAGVIAPNTVAEHATVSYSVPARSRVVVEITDALGRHVKTITDEVQDIGRYSTPLDMSESASGAYFCVMHVGTITQTLPVQVVR
jgi:D-alanyl-D-alanine carboxypeptidase